MLALLKPYKSWVLWLVGLGLLSNALNLVLPELIGEGINRISLTGALDAGLRYRFLWAIGCIVVLGSCQNFIQVYTAERVARDLRQRLAEKLSYQSYGFLLTHDPSRLLTNLTSDVDAVKVFVSQVIAGLISSVVILSGASVLLLRLNLRLGLAVLTIVPLIAVTFYAVLKSVRPLFKQGRLIIDALNRVIEESVVGAALIRVLHLGKLEGERFAAINRQARGLGEKILAHFAFMSPAATFFSNMGTLIILTLGGWQVIGGQMKLGDIAAFNSYLALLIFPIFVIGFMGNLISSAHASYVRIEAVLGSTVAEVDSPHLEPLRGELDVTGVSLAYGERTVLRDISFHLEPGSRTAVVGPTAAGKTQLLYLLVGLIEPSEGSLFYDGTILPTHLGRQVAMVFQDSALFHGTLKENIAFHPSVSPQGLAKALKTAELDDFVASLPHGLNTQVSERGTSLSGGQKQRVMLARALATDPDVLLLDDFTARLDPVTEAKVGDNLLRHYPHLTILTVTQRTEGLERYDQILLMMEGQLLAKGTHRDLLGRSPEYVQILESQKSTQFYE